MINWHLLLYGLGGCVIGCIVGFLAVSWAVKQIIGKKLL